jgi:hypothetical protein
MSEVNNTKKKLGRPAKHSPRTMEAATMVWAANGKVSVPIAMKLVGFNTPDAKGVSREGKKQRGKQLAVRFRVNQLKGLGVPESLFVNGEDLPPTVIALHNAKKKNEVNRETDISSLTDEPAPKVPHVAKTSAVINLVDEEDKKLPAADSLSAFSSVGTGEGSSTVATSKRGLEEMLGVAQMCVRDLKKTRRLPSQVQASFKKKSLQEKHRKEAFKEVTSRVAASRAMSPKNPKKQTDKAIVMASNKKFGTTFTTASISRNVKKGFVGVSPTKPGPSKPLPKIVYDALKGVYTTFVLLEQVIGTSQSTAKQLCHRVNIVANSGPLGVVYNSSRQLHDNLRRDCAMFLATGKINKQELRRAEWTTYTNLDKWYDTWKMQLIDLGFAREAKAKDNVEGELLFFEGQTRRIINLDETAATLDSTQENRGGRPPVVFHSENLSAGATRANKTGYSCTLICGSSAAGQPLPPHFQLKSEAKAENQRFSIEHLENQKMVFTHLGGLQPKEYSTTFGFNEKAGMNEIEFWKFLEATIPRWFPDVENKKGLRVIIKVDSGPGRKNYEKLAKFRLMGIYVIVGVPNSTAVTQETDQNYGPFKQMYYVNLEILVKFRIERSMTLTMLDIGKLVFGCEGKEGEDPKLHDAFSAGFGIETNKQCWAKCGAVPLTRNGLTSDKVHHDIIVDADGVIDLEADPTTAKMIALEQHNHACCNALSDMGMDPSQLFSTAPKVTTKKIEIAVTRPMSKERILALCQAKGAGDLFRRTGGDHLCTDEMMIAIQMGLREAEIKKKEAEKTKRIELFGLDAAARTLIDAKEVRTKGISHLLVPDLKILVAWKRGLKTVSLKKEELKKAWNDEPEPEPVQAWSEVDEFELNQMRQPITVGETNLGSEFGKMVNAVLNSSELLTDEQMEGLERVIRERAILEAQHMDAEQDGSRY